MVVEIILCYFKCQLHALKIKCSVYVRCVIFLLGVVFIRRCVGELGVSGE